QAPPAARRGRERARAARAGPVPRAGAAPALSEPRTGGPHRRFRGHRRWPRGDRARLERHAGGDTGQGRGRARRARARDRDAAGALEEGVVRPDDRFFGENGAITIARTTIHDWKKYGWLTFSEVLQNSSNVGSIKVGLALGAERYYRYMTAFGFGRPTGLGLPGESRGQLREPPRWSTLSLPTLSLGQEVSVTALQMVTAFSAVANGGTLMR